MSRRFNCVVFRDGDPRRTYDCAGARMFDHSGCTRWCSLKDANAALVRRCIGADPAWPHSGTAERRGQDHAKNDLLQANYAAQSARDGEAYLRQLDAEYALRLAQERRQHFQKRKTRR